MGILIMIMLPDLKCKYHRESEGCHDACLTQRNLNRIIMLLQATVELCEWEFLLHCHGEVGVAYLVSIVQHEPDSGDTIQSWIYVYVWVTLFKSITTWPPLLQFNLHFPLNHYILPTCEKLFLRKAARCKRKSDAV